MAEEILLAEDDPQIYELIKIILENKGYTLHWAQDGEEAVHQAQKIHPDLILLDVMMPKLNGYEVLHLLKEDMEMKDIPIIFVTALSQTTEKIVGLRMGGQDYITKPFDIYELIARIEAALRIKSTPVSLRRTNRRISDLALADPLTGLYNYTYFSERMAEELERARKHQYPIACLLLMIDNFSLLQSRYGNLQAEQVIQRLAILLKDRNRVVDMLGRYREEKIILLLPQTDEGGAQAVGKRFQQCIQRSRLLDTDPAFLITISVGAAAFTTGHIGHQEKLLQKATLALTAAQSQGNNHLALASKLAYK